MLANLLTTTVTIQHKTVTTGSSGNGYVYTTAYTNVPASVQPGADRAQFYVDGRKITAEWIVWTDTAVTVNPDDRVIWRGLTLHVHYVKNLIGLDRVYAIHCEQRLDGA